MRRLAPAPRRSAAEPTSHPRLFMGGAARAGREVGLGAVRWAGAGHGGMGAAGVVDWGWVGAGGRARCGCAQGARRGQGADSMAGTMKRATKRPATTRSPLLGNRASDSSRSCTHPTHTTPLPRPPQRARTQTHASSGTGTCGHVQLHAQAPSADISSCGSDVSSGLVATADGPGPPSSISECMHRPGAPTAAKPAAPQCVQAAARCGPGVYLGVDTRARRRRCIHPKKDRSCADRSSHERLPTRDGSGSRVRDLGGAGGGEGSPGASGLRSPKRCSPSFPRVTAFLSEIHGPAPSALPLSPSVLALPRWPLSPASLSGESPPRRAESLRRGGLCTAEARLPLGREARRGGRAWCIRAIMFLGTRDTLDLPQSPHPHARSHAHARTQSRTPDPAPRPRPRPSPTQRF